MKDVRETWYDAANRVAVTIVDVTTAAQDLARGHLCGPTSAYFLTKALAAADEREQNRVALTPVLGLEDAGAEAAETLRFGNVVTPVADLIEKRYTARRFTVVTTNLTPPEMRSRYGARVADRLNEMMQVVIFRAASYRR